VEEIQGVSQSSIEHLWHAAKRHDAWYLKRWPETKRYAMAACSLLEADAGRARSEAKRREGRAFNSGRRGEKPYAVCASQSIK
jgi:hypothetical protein